MQIRVANVNDMFAEMFRRLVGNSVKEDSRNGPVLRYDEPVLTQMEFSTERVLTHKVRDANPIFHLMESLWVLAGRRDVAFLEQFNSRIGQYSDDGLVFNAAYGYRMRHHFGFDQLKAVIELLQRDPLTRQAVVQLWDPLDLIRFTKDKACNMQLIFAQREGKLDLTVINRSNDMWWGYAGANVVHFTVLLEFVARAVGLEPGCYYTVSNNLHLYTELYDAKSFVAVPPQPEFYDAYNRVNNVQPAPLVTDTPWEEWLEQCEAFCNDPFTYPEGSDKFFTDVAYPMAMISRSRKLKTGDGTEWLPEVAAQDWRLAASEWLDKRNERQLPLF